MFKCKACAAKDAHLASLQAEVELLRRLAIPHNDPKAIPVFSLEADSVLEGKQDMIVMDAHQAAEFERAMGERDRLLSGNYDNVEALDG